MNPANNDELFNEYESLEENLVADEDLVDNDEVFYTYDENYEDISDIENNNNNEPLFELDFNTLTKVKQFTQQNTSDEEDESITSDTESNFSESESDEEHDEIITQLKDKQELSPCVIIDVFEGKIQRCNSTTNLRRLWQMVGMWQIDEEEIKKKHFSIKNLGVCYTHFMFDQNKLHITNLNRGKNCIHHSYIVMGKNIQVPCIGQKKCGTLQEYHPLVISTESSKYARYICMVCYEKKGGHVYQRVGRDVKEDPNFRVITQLNQEKSNNTSDILIPLADTKTEIPSLFIILIILALMKFNYNLDKKLNPKNLTPKNFFEFGEALAHSTILAKNELKLHKKSLESPISIEEYRASFPLCLVQFYNGLLETLYKTKKKIIDQKKKHRE
ncbi:hypothetical protein RhiirC2_794693 [Rhizophagus irregularis]|uniref:Uncharacterized protein n=1 Tax=Rhizophagus irregularis TaxID=588596 RepID=A0A2N1MD42_9GLOM|nr:hypothetical protein RhiirC2_794693 [Rhizophagus irregularis]